MNFKKATLAAALALGLFGAAHADLTVGVVLPLTGPASGLGIPVKNQIALWPKTIAGENLKVVVLDDATDPTTGVKDTQRLAVVMAALEHSQSPEAFSYKKPEKNPFSLTTGPSKAVDNSDELNQQLAERDAETRRRRQEQLETTLGAMHLNGIIGGKGNFIASRFNSITTIRMAYTLPTVL